MFFLPFWFVFLNSASEVSPSQITVKGVHYLHALPPGYGAEWPESAQGSQRSEGRDVTDAKQLRHQAHN